MAMDFISGPMTTTTTTPRTPDSDTDTPPHPPPTKRPHHHHHHHNNHRNNNHNNNNNHVHVSYKECLKNHAASIGGHALDGCCEFMPRPTANLLDPTSLTCAACGCHRNFHRRDPDDPTPLHHLIPAARNPHSPPSASQLLLSLSAHPNSPDHEILQTPTTTTTTTATTGTAVITGYFNGGGGGQNGNLSFNNSKKRFRTKFSQEQKEKMYEFSEKIGWKLKKGEEKLVEDFVKEIGVDRSVFKVWMHNNKHSSSTSSVGQRREKIMVDVVSDTTTILSTSITTNGNHSNNNNNHSNNNNNNNSNNNSNSNNVGLINNCGGVLGSATTGLEFNFGNGGAQEAKAQ